MTKRMPPEVLEYLKSMGKKYGAHGGKRSLETMTPEERSRARTATFEGESVNEMKAVPGRTAPAPSRARTAASRIICSSPR